MIHEEKKEEEWSLHASLSFQTLLSGKSFPLRSQGLGKGCKDKVIRAPPEWRKEWRKSVISHLREDQKLWIFKNLIDDKW